MFGTLKPHSCTLSEEHRLAHRRFYCGLCKTLGDEYALWSRALLHFDAVFIGVIGDALMIEAGGHDACRCPMMPLQHRPTISPKSPAMRYAAAIQMMLFDQWMADKEVEGKKSAQWARKLLAKDLTHTQDIFDELGIDLSELKGFEHTQADCECQGSTDVVEASQPTEDALAIVFARLLALPGIAPTAQTEANASQLAALGATIGRVIYVSDALEDLKDDYVEEAFNPCLSFTASGELHIDASKVEAACELLAQAQTSLHEQLQRVPWLRHQAIIENILCDQFARMSQQAIRQAKLLVVEEKLRDLARWKQRSWWDRTTTTLFVFLTTWWASFFSGALAQLTDQASKSGPPGGLAGNTGYEQSLANELGGQDATNTAHGDCCGINAICQGIGNCFDTLGDTCHKTCSCSCLKDCNAQCGKCSESCNPDKCCNCKECESCQKCNCCDDCGKTCDGCGNDCTESCGNGCCKGCNKGCDGCGKGCDSCGKSCEGCGKSCEGCGKGCDGCGKGCDGCGNCANCKANGDLPNVC